MTCEDISQHLEDLKRQKRELNAVIGNLQGAGLQAAQAQLASLESQIATEEIRLADCQAIDDSPAQPFTGRVKEIFCSEASKEIGKDEPYVLIAAVDMLSDVQAGPFEVPKPTVHCVKVGPWTGVKAGSTHSTAVLANGSKPAFWDLDGEARVVAQPEDAIFLASLVEHDGASPDAIRGAVHTALELSIHQNAEREYNSLAETLASAMQGAIDASAGLGVGPGHLNFDDRVGDARQIELTDRDLDTINGHGRLEKAVTFTRKNKSGKISDQYTVTFLFET